MKKSIIVLAGPTAVGKTEYAVEIAGRFDGEIVSADSMQLYKHMDIGSGKPDKAQLSRARHHLIGEIDPKEPFSVAEYKTLAKNAITDILERGKQPIVSGGTGLYINSLIYDMDFTAPPAESGYRLELERLAAEYGNEYIHKRLAGIDQKAAERIHPNNLKKVIRALEVAENSDNRIKPFEDSFKAAKDYEARLVCLTRERRELYGRINKRVDEFMEKGLPGEVKTLLDMGLTIGNNSMKGIGYKELIGFFSGEYDMERAVFLIKQNTRRYAKRQLTWFRRYENMKWFNISEYKDEEEALEDVIKWLREKK